MGNKSSRSDLAREFTKTKFPSNLKEKYAIGQTCRQSGCSTSKRVTEKTTGNHYVAEYWNKVTTDKEIEDLARIHRIFKSLEHPNLLKLHEMYKISEQRYVFVTERYQDSDLFDVIAEKTANSEMTEDEVARYTHQLLKALQYLHQQGIIHRDVKPEWSLFRDKERGEILLHPGQFCVESGQTDKLTGICGTLGYLAPEIANRKEYSKDVDMWSLGVTVFVMLSGTMPFISCSDPETLELVKRAEFEFNPENWSARSEEAREFVKSLMTVSPERRITCEQALNHPWVVKHV